MPAVPAVLLVEDNPADARLLQEMVSASGEHDLILRPCRTLAEAIKEIEEAATDCVLLDLSLPDVSASTASTSSASGSRICRSSSSPVSTTRRSPSRRLAPELRTTW